MRTSSPFNFIFATLFTLFTLLLTLTTSQPIPTTYKCKTPSAKCQSLIDYVSPNTTTLSNIQTLFGVKNFRNILGANNLPLSTPLTKPVNAKQVIRIPFPCTCNQNGTGISNKRPIYTVQPGDTLDHIARDVFAELVTFQQIQAANRIADANVIEVGQNFTIPLPCSCDAVDGAQVVHYGHVVPAGSTVAGIASQFGTSESTLLMLSGLPNANSLTAGSVLDVPLKACTSELSNTSIDYPLLVPNGTYTFTAHNCVQCKCDASKNWTLQCGPSPKSVKVSDWSQCPPMQCQGTNSSVVITLPSTGCQRTTCSYAGYNSSSILTTLVNNFCPTDGASGPSTADAPSGPPTADGASGPPGSYATRNHLQGWNWTWLLISLSLGFLRIGLHC